MKILILFVMSIFIQACFLYSSDEAWNNKHKMYKESNGRKICMKYKGDVHVMYYCENEDKE